MRLKWGKNGLPACGYGMNLCACVRSCVCVCFRCVCVCGHLSALNNLAIKNLRLLTRWWVSMPILFNGNDRWPPFYSWTLQMPWLNEPVGKPSVRPASLPRPIFREAKEHLHNWFGSDHKLSNKWTDKTTQPVPIKWTNRPISEIKIHWTLSLDSFDRFNTLFL